MFHVGAHKTGTTLLQDFLGQNVKALRARRIMHVPRGRMARLVGWGDALCDEPDEFISELRRFWRDPAFDMIALSHEDTLGHPFERGGDGTLYPHARQNLSALSAAVGARPITIALSLRPQHEFLESYYLQTVQEGQFRPFDQWLAQVDLERLSWAPVVSAATEIFGADRVALINFKRIREGQDSYLRHFCAVVGIPTDFDVSVAASRNRSFSDKALHMALGANPYLNSITERRELRDFLQRYFSNADYPAAELLTDTQVSRLQDLYGPEFAGFRWSKAGDHTGNDLDPASTST